MKKRYVISIIIVSIFLLSFFAYNKLFNKQISEYNNIIGIYLEDNYESNTYTLSNSSDIPSDDYIFNAEKTNEECPNATFIYDSESNKVKVNSNKSVECNMYFKSNLPQLVHYQFLYDGSLGDAGKNGANNMLTITGGWNDTFYTDYYTSNVTTFNYSFNTNYVHIDASSNRSSKYFRFKNVIDLSNYKYIYAYWSTSQSGDGSNGPAIQISPTNCNITTSDCSNNKSSWIGCNNETDFCNSTPHFNYTEKKSNETYIFFGAHFNGSGTLSADLYYLFIISEDDYSALASKINVTVSSIDDLLNNYSTQLLNNEKSVKYMIKQCTGDFMASAINNPTFMSAYQSSPYKTMIDANLHWKKFIDMSTL